MEMVTKLQWIYQPHYPSDDQSIDFKIITLSLHILKLVLFLFLVADK